MSRKNNILSFSNIKINFQGEQFPNINSKIHLSNKKDIFGQNIPIMDWKLSEIDHQTQQETRQQKLRAIRFEYCRRYSEVVFLAFGGSCKSAADHC